MLTPSFEPLDMVSRVPIRNHAMEANAREAALKRGVDELQGRLEWVLQKRPRALKTAKRRYQEFCFRLYGAIERAATVRR
jgi:hypothetical protein